VWEDKTIALPLSRLHYVRTGAGEPLIIVPATISEISNWKNLIEFMGQKFTVYFFELPGHGQSTPFTQKYRNELVAQTVRDFTDELGIQKFNLMGFSFGGILAMHVLDLMPERVGKVLLIAPALDVSLLKHAVKNQLVMRFLIFVGQFPVGQRLYCWACHNESAKRVFLFFLRKIAHVEHTDQLGKKLGNIRKSTIITLAMQANELLHLTAFRGKRFEHQCYFAMSKNDPLIDCDKTVEFMRRMFPHSMVKVVDFPYHQGREPFSLGFLQQQFSGVLEKVAKGEVLD